MADTIRFETNRQTRRLHNLRDLLKRGLLTKSAHLGICNDNTVGMSRRYGQWQLRVTISRCLEYSRAKHVLELVWGWAPVRVKKMHQIKK